MNWLKRNGQTILLLLTFAVFVNVSPASSAGLQPDTLSVNTVERIDAFVSEQMQRHALPGLALALVEGDQVIFMQGYGAADQTGRPITPQTPFILASISKPLTATAIMQLVEAGKVELDAPVQRYLPEFQLADPAASADITVRHLLLHTSGIPATACDTRRDAATLADFVAELKSVQPAAPAGSRYIYCSGNYNVLGRILEVVSGQSFGDYMQGQIFTPLGMEHSFTSEADARLDGLAQGYQWFFGLKLPTRHPYNPSQLPSGYMISSVEDMSRFLIAHLNQGRYADVQLLSKESIAAMQAPGAQRGNGGEYGFGWVIAPFGDVPAVWHDGVNISYHSLLLMEPEAERGVIVLMNSFGIVPYEGAYKEIEAGIVRLFADLEPAPPARSLGATYSLIDALLAFVLALVLIPLLRMRAWKRWLAERHHAGTLPLMRVSMRAGWEIFFAVTFLTVIRAVIVTGMGAQSWYEVLTAFPDFVLWIWLFALTVLLTGILRMKLIVQMR